MTKRILAIAVTALLITGAQAQSGKKMIVSIGTFKNKSRCPDIAFRSLLDRITNGIVNTRKFTVVDNARLKEALVEKQKGDMGMSDAKTAPQGGKIKSAGYVLYGTVLALGATADAVELNGITGTKFTATVELNVRFMDVNTGELIASKTVKTLKSVSELRSGVHAAAGNKSELAVQDAVQAASDAVVEKLMELAFPTVILKVSGSQVYVNLTEERARPDALLHVFAVGEALTDPDTGEALGSSEELIGSLKIVRTSPKYAIAEPVPPLTTAKLAKGMIVRPVSARELEAIEAKTTTQEVKRFQRRF